MATRWTFGLPPSAGDALLKSGALKTVLSDLGFPNFRRANTYGDLIRDLIVGRCHAAWATPAVCAQVEDAGGRVVLRAIKQGQATYRSVIFARAVPLLQLHLLKGLRAAWPDAQSLSGYILPRTLLLAHGLEPMTTFSKETFVGSFQACVDAVLEKRADISATEAPPEGVNAPPTFAQLAGARAAELAPLAYSPECPFGGIVLSPTLVAKDQSRVARQFSGLLADATVLASVSSALGVDAFEVPPPGSYARLYNFLRASPKEKLTQRPM